MAHDEKLFILSQRNLKPGYVLAIFFDLGLLIEHTSSFDLKELGLEAMICLWNAS